MLGDEDGWREVVPSKEQRERERERERERAITTEREREREVSKNGHNQETYPRTPTARQSR